MRMIEEFWQTRKENNRMKTLSIIVKVDSIKLIRKYWIFIMFF